MTIAGYEQMWFLSLILTVPRILGAFLAMPFLGRTILPGLVRNGLVVVIAAFASPITLASVEAVPLDALQVGFLLLKEMLIGFMMGYLISIPFWAVGSAGFFIDLQSGKMSAQMFSNILSDQTSPLGDFLSKFAVVLLFTTGGFLIIVEVLLKSYQVWPVHSFFPHLNIEGAGVFLHQFALLFYTAVLIAGPIIATMFIVELGSSIITRYVPQLNIFILLMPIKAGIAAFLLVYYIQYISAYLRASFLRFGDSFQLLEEAFK